MSWAWPQVVRAGPGLGHRLWAAAEAAELLRLAADHAAAGSAGALGCGGAMGCPGTDGMGDSTESKRPSKLCELNSSPRKIGPFTIILYSQY